MDFRPGELVMGVDELKLWYVMTASNRGWLYA